ncbi:SpoIIE family protein phosphatase [Desulfogranum japonicum]|uniref:SpoIIE family protein phosphatase n=1 Tax=Desulfogranum japonicum TaxID=231447 RepID=UPI000404EEFC|nr:SpoIIE family protein phosphatase [Desulfogranum japonicum]
MHIDFHLEKKAHPASYGACGDTGFIRQTGNSYLLALVDALGHGEKAEDIARKAEAFLQENANKEDPADIIRGIHQCLRETRGAVAAVCRLEIPTGRILYSGMGNITLRIFGKNPQSLITRDGILGYRIPNPVTDEVLLNPGDIFVMSSDGLREHYDPDIYPGLLQGTSRDICLNLMKKLGKGTDDMSCIVLRYSA